MKQAFVSKRVLGLGRTRLVVVSSVALVCVAAAASALATTRAQARAAEAKSSVVGAWHATVYAKNPDGSSVAPFDTLYVFNRDGGSIRIDGRNNAPGVGAWREDIQHRVAWTVVLFAFNGSTRTGTITSKQDAWVDANGMLQGTFKAEGVDLAGNTLPGFPKTGTFSGERIEAPAP
jgi:predicted lipoprotein with Yx(FWY)xxD motif